jgi:hypothetical protein
MLEGAADATSENTPEKIIKTTNANFRLNTADGDFTVNLHKL